MLFTNAEVISTVSSNVFFPKKRVYRFLAKARAKGKSRGALNRMLDPLPWLRHPYSAQVGLHRCPIFYTGTIIVLCYAVVKVPIGRMFSFTRLRQPLVVERAGGSGSKTRRD